MKARVTRLWPRAMSDHERIYLEPEDGSDPDAGRMWCQHPAPGAGDDRTWTEYVRADLVAAQVAAAEAHGRKAGLREAAEIAHAAREKAERGAADEWGYGDSLDVRRRLYARAHEAKELASAILARIEAKP